MVRKRKSSGRMASKGFPNPVDVHVGARVRQRRMMMGMSQASLGEAIGLTFQQIQKYERGANRISASRLWGLAVALETPVAYFFADMDQPNTAATDDLMGRRETLEMVRAYWRIEDPGLRKSVFAHIKAIAGESAEP